MPIKTVVLGNRFRQLELGLAKLKEELGPTWQRTTVAVVTEFGRTVRQNGGKGSDHGTGGVALVLGGAVKGGQIYGDWPGLAPNQLYENRDLYPANDNAGTLCQLAAGTIRYFKVADYSNRPSRKAAACARLKLPKPFRLYGAGVSAKSKRSGTKTTSITTPPTNSGLSGIPTVTMDRIRPRPPIKIPAQTIRMAAKRSSIFQSVHQMASVTDK